MNGTCNRWIFLGSIMGFFAVLFGSAGAHWLEPYLHGRYGSIFDTAFRLHLIHSVVIIVATLVMRNAGRTILLSSSLWFFIFGTIIFSGSLYLYSITHWKFFGAAAPMGGFTLMLGWIALALGALKSYKKT